jgi:hypothetical protein
MFVTGSAQTKNGTEDVGKSNVRGAADLGLKSSD